MPEVRPDFTRAWVEFPDPDESGQIIRADLTWLTSRWTCIFGSGCPGVYADRPDEGCCSLGAHFADDADERRVLQAAGELTVEDWQFADQSPDLADADEEGARKTATHDGACVFLNRAGSAMGPGCALHRLAARTGRSFVETKPDVCWQLPLRRTYDWREEQDGSQVLVVTLTEYVRAGWGAGGHDFDWYCSSNSDAHVGSVPVFRGNEREIVELIGRRAADVLIGLCEQHTTAQQWRTEQGLPAFALHPASAVGGRD